jgi:hypothetical protein
MLAIFLIIYVRILGDRFCDIEKKLWSDLDEEILIIRKSLKSFLVNNRHPLNSSCVYIMCNFLQSSLFRDKTQIYAKQILRMAHKRSRYEIWPSLVIFLELVLKNEYEDAFE